MPRRSRSEPDEARLAEEIGVAKKKLPLCSGCLKKRWPQQSETPEKGRIKTAEVTAEKAQVLFFSIKPTTHAQTKSYIFQVLLKKIFLADAKGEFVRDELVNLKNKFD